MLHYSCVKSARAAMNAPAIRVMAAVADMPRALDPAPQARDRKTAFPAALERGVYDFDYRVHQHGERGGVVECFRLIHTALRASGRRLKDHQPQRHMHLWRGKTRAVGVF